jgi:hypothetical protein
MTRASRKAIRASGMLILALGAVATAQGSAKTKSPPALGIVEELRIPLPETRAQRGASLLIGADGRMIAVPLWGGEMVAFDSTGKQLPYKQTIGGSADPEIRYAEKFGWVGKTMWVWDPPSGQIALVDPQLKVTKSLEVPSWIRPSWADRRKYPVFGRMGALAVYPDGSWLVVPSSPKSLVDTPDYDKTMSYMVRISESGSIQRTIARVPWLPNAPRGGRPPGSMKQPAPSNFAFWNSSADGSRILIGIPSTTAGDSNHVITVINEKGDTIYSRSMLFADQVASARVARDGSVWLQLRGRTGDRTWLTLDPSGQQRGILTFENNSSIYDADGSRIWTTERVGPTQFLVRYRVTAAPPPRTPAPSKASGRPRPPASASPSSR